MFINDGMVDLMVEFTNEKAKIFYENWNYRNIAKPRQWVPTDEKKYMVCSTLDY